MARFQMTSRGTLEVLSEGGGAVLEVHRYASVSCQGFCSVYGCMHGWYVWIYVCMHVHTHTHTHTRIVSVGSRDLCWSRALLYTHTHTHIRMLVVAGLSCGRDR